MGHSVFYEQQFKKKLEKRTLSKTIDIDVKNIDIQKKNRKKIHRMMLIIREIRKKCKEIIGDKYELKYHLLSQFIVLYGLQKYTDKYNPFIVIPFLSKLGEQVRKFKYE